MKTIVFTVPKQPPPIATMAPATAVKAIAFAWRVRTGQLEAPAALVAAGKVLANTRLNFGSSIEGFLFLCPFSSPIAGPKSR